MLPRGPPSMPSGLRRGHPWDLPHSWAEICSQIGWPSWVARKGSLAHGLYCYSESWMSDHGVKVALEGDRRDNHRCGGNIGEEGGEGGSHTLDRPLEQWMVGCCGLGGCLLLGASGLLWCLHLCFLPVPTYDSNLGEAHGCELDGLLLGGRMRVHHLGKGPQSPSKTGSNPWQTVTYSCPSSRRVCFLKGISL